MIPALFYTGKTKKNCKKDLTGSAKNAAKPLEKIIFKEGFTWLSIPTN
jgi:hypothetical protein